jgi:RecA/RadA recombinase|tara:strand:- start:3278 stop:4297 length:1020 start_codon:yes stop_codon:yes gene_type:complete
MTGFSSGSIMDKLKKNSKIKETSILSDSKFFTEKDMVQTDVPMINLALSGSLDGGLAPGLTVLAGPSKHFKTSFALIMASAYLKKYEDSILLFYDSEFGSPQSYFETFGIDTNRVLHTPVTNVEELKFDIISQLEQLDRNDKVCVVIDSVGNLASKKELEDAINEKSVADMSRAKALKGLFRMVTPYLNMKDIPLIAVNHTYQEIGLFPKAIVSGGTGIYYSADNIWILGRQQDKQGTEIKGYHFIINVEKSRYVKEKSKIPISVSWEGGVQKWSGLLEVAMEGGYVSKPSPGWYAKVDRETGEISDSKVREKDTLTEEFWEPIITDEFKQYLTKKFKI